MAICGDTKKFGEYMNKTLITKVATGGVLVAALVGGALHANIIKLPITKKIHSLYIAGLEDDRKMIGNVHNVFMGKVVKKIRSQDSDIIPTTQFNVEVLYNVKGDLNGTIVVSQEGGYRNGILYVVLDGDILLPGSASSINDFLQPGELYLFYTRYDEQNGWHAALFHPNATKLLPWDKNLNAAQLQIIAQKDDRIKALQEAYKNEILDDADIKAGNTRNSYQSLQGK